MELSVFGGPSTMPGITTPLQCSWYVDILDVSCHYFIVYVLFILWLPFRSESLQGCSKMLAKSRSTRVNNTTTEI